MLNKTYTLKHDNVLIERNTEEKTTKSGLILVTEADEITTGKVLGVGPGLKNEKGHLAETEVQVGDIVLFPTRQTTKVTLEGQKLFVIKEDQLYGIVQN